MATGRSPELRIVPDDLWKAAHDRNTEVNRLGIARLGGLCRTQSSRTYLFSGLLVCGECRSNMVIISGGGKRGYVKYGCHAHKHSGVCSNNWTIRRDRLECQLVGAIEKHLLSREILDYAVRQCERAIRERLAEWKRAGETTTLDSLHDRRATLKAQGARLAEAIGVGGDLPSLLERLRDVEKQVAEVERTTIAYRPRNLDLKAEQIRELVLKAILQLRKVLDEGDVQRARSALSKHLGRLVLTPTLKDGKKIFRVTGAVNLQPGNGVMQLVARDGIGPPTVVDSA
jgi:hypothetical protein